MDLPGQDPSWQSSRLAKYRWSDITDEFIHAAKELRLGQLLHDENFGLFEAMSAIEMMDPKMDAGMLCNQVTRPVLSLEQAVEAGKVKLNDLTHSELIGIMDATLACVETWMEGHSLAQTVFTNLYLHNPYIISDRCLKAFSICVLKTVDLIRDRVNRASVYEEEDFQPMTYGFRMASDVTDMRATGMMREVEEELHRLVKTKRGKGTEELDQKEYDAVSAVYSRVRFYRLFFTMLIAISKDKCEGLEQATKLLSQLQELIPCMEKTIPLGCHPDTKEKHSNDGATIMGFEPLINQRLLPPTFPRYTSIKSRMDCMQYLRMLISRLRIVVILQQQGSLHAILETFLQFSKTSPCVLSRSLLQLTFLSPSRRIFGTQTFVDMLRDSIRGFIASPALMQKSSLYSHSQAKEYVDAFLTHAVRPIMSIFQITGHNRARQRDKWAQLLHDLTALQDEADKLDTLLHALLSKLEPGRQHIACFGTWVLYHTLRVMIHYTLAGFELELYATYEYHYIFWYLYELLYAWLVSSLSRSEQLLLEHEALADQQQQKGRSNKKVKKKRKPRGSSQELLATQGALQLCGGFYKALFGFMLAGRLRQPQFEFDREEVRYTHRFAPFAAVNTPPMMSYAQFKDSTDLSRYDPKPRALDLFLSASKCFQQAKNHFESITNPSEEVQTNIKIAKTNFIVLNLLLSGHKNDSKEPPEFDFCFSKVFPVIRLS